MIFSTDKMLTIVLYIIGVEGDSNALCFNTATLGPLAVDLCRVNSDCLYGECTQERCTVPALSCKTTVAGKIKSPVHISRQCIFLRIL
jgi:hypothetical protein